MQSTHRNQQHVDLHNDRLDGKALECRCAVVGQRGVAGGDQVVRDPAVDAHPRSRRMARRNSHQYRSPGRIAKPLMQVGHLVAVAGHIRPDIGGEAAAAVAFLGEIGAQRLDLRGETLDERYQR